MSNDTVIGDRLEASDAWIVHTKIQQTREDPFQFTTQVIEFLKFFDNISNLQGNLSKLPADSQNNFYPWQTGDTSRDRRMFLLELLGMGNSKDTFNSCPFYFIVLVPTHQLKTNQADTFTIFRNGKIFFSS